MRVFKFGGASVKDANAIRNVAKILQDYKGEQLVVVVSAIGKTTNALETVVDGAFENAETGLARLQGVKSAHWSILQQLFGAEHAVYQTLNKRFEAMEKFVNAITGSEDYDFVYDQVVSQGEMLSTEVISAFLNSEGVANSWLDACSVVATDDTYREGTVNWKQTEAQAQSIIVPLWEDGIVVTQGFLGGTPLGHITTLGREGSDYTAAILAYCLNAESMTVWKDVPGILTADPRLFKNVTKIDRLSYREAIEMTYYGAKVIHPKTIKPLQNKNIALFVRSFENPQADGTMISGVLDVAYPPVVVVEKDQVLLHIARTDFSFVTEGSLGELFLLFNKYRIKVNMMQNTAISFSVCTDNKPRRLANLLPELQGDYNVIKDEGLELVTVRHYTPEVLTELKRGKMVIMEERIRNTVQLVMRQVPMMQRIDS